MSACSVLVIQHTTELIGKHTGLVVLPLIGLSSEFEFSEGSRFVSHH